MFEQWEAAMEDAAFLNNAVKTCSDDPSIKRIVVVTHTVPHRDLAWMPTSNNVLELGTQGSSFLEEVKSHDSNDKLKIWCFGHLHHAVDMTVDGVRYVSNPRGIPAHVGAQMIYYPKCIKC